jgi:hypothetical protein
MNLRSLALVLALPLAGCAAQTADTTTDDGVAQSTDELGKAKHHYEPGVSGLVFNGGCGIVMNPPQQNCSYGFEMTYERSYVDLKTTVSHKTDNKAHTITITVDTWSYNTIHPMMMVGPEKYDLGMLDANVGQGYTVKVVDRTNKSLWTGKVQTLFHM